MHNMNRKEKATELYKSDYNCAQSVVKAFEDYLGTKTQTLVDMAKGFGGGMGRLQLTCGALTGAFMVMSSLYKNSTPEDKNQLTKDIQEIASRFNEVHGDLNCKALIKYDLNDEKEHQKAKDEKVFEEKCTKFIETSVELVDEFIEKSKNHIDGI